MTHSAGDSQRTHLTEAEVSGYLSGIFGEAQRKLIQAHLAGCDECTHELAEVWQLRPPRAGVTYGRQPRSVAFGAAAGIAALLALLVWAGRDRDAGPPEFREPAISFAAAPSPIAPLGTVTPPIAFQWSSVPSADRYRLLVHDRDGSVVWEAVLHDTTVGLPDSVQVSPGKSYLWKVKAEAGWGRSAESPLTRFEISDPAR
jgi:hypothetical protein